MNVRPDDFDVYPIIHEGKVYNVITALDMTFKEVHSMLARLEEQGAFSGASEDEDSETGKLLECRVLGVTFDVDVLGYEVIVYRRRD